MLTGVQRGRTHKIHGGQIACCNGAEKCRGYRYIILCWFISGPVRNLQATWVPNWYCAAKLLLSVGAFGRSLAVTGVVWSKQERQ